MKRAVLTSMVIVSLLAWSADSTRAAKVKAWHHHASADHEEAQFEHAVINDAGVIKLSRRLRPLVKIDAAHVWDIVEDKLGNLFVATGDEGKILKITPKGKVSVAYESDEVQVLCLALASDGSIYAGTGPNGHVVRIDAAGKASVLYDSPASYVWSLAVSPRGDTIFAGTGPRGRIYQISRAGKASVYYTTKQKHILCLALDDKGNLFAGTDKGGLVYKIDPVGKGFVLYHTPQAEVRSLLVTEEGVFAGTSTPVSRSSGKSGSGGALGALLKLEGSSLEGIKVVSTEAEAPLSTSKGSGKASSSSSSKEDKGASAPEPPEEGDNSVYHIAHDGTVRELFRAKKLMLSLQRDAGRMLVGTGMKGQIFEIIEKTRERCELARLEHGQVHCLRKRRDGSIIVGTGDPGMLYVLEDKFNARGSVVSKVLDAKIISKWGALRWHAEAPAGTCVSVAVRTGNVAEPDETWSAWSAEQFDADKAIIAAPAARFLQYRVTLVSKDASATPALRNLTLRYRTTNQAPEVTELKAPDLAAGDLEDPKKITLKWKALDPNEDELTYKVQARKQGWEHWVTLGEDIEKKEFEWDTTTMPSGEYCVKVVASDARDNPPAEALSGQRVSVPFVVAHTPPQVSLRVEKIDGDKVQLTARASDPLARLSAASYSINGGKWRNVFPADGLFDDRTESFRFKISDLKVSTYVLVLRVTDAAGNTGTADAIFKIEGPGK